METPTPGSTFSREPVMWVTGVMAALHIVCGTAGLADLIGPNLTMALQIVLAAADALLAVVIVRPSVTPNQSVVAYEYNGTVYAGPANEIDTDIPIREESSIDQDPPSGADGIPDNQPKRKAE